LAESAYLDFVIEIGKGEGLEYPVSVLTSPAGEARQIMRFPFDRLALENHLLRLERTLLKSGGKRRQVLSPDQQDVRDFGMALFNALFSGEARSRYDVSLERARQAKKGLRIQLRIQDARLAALPWEFLCDPRKDYLCLSNRTPLVRYLELPEPPQPLAVQPPLRILGMVASPSDLPALDVACEKQRVEAALKGLRAAGKVELTWLEGATWRDLQRALRGGPWHIFHFIGHGGYDAHSDQGLVALCDEGGKAFRLPADKLGQLLANHPALRLALLNACEGARGGETDIFSSTASILVRAGVPAVAAMQYEITDDAAIEFSRSFYEALADGLPVDAAISEARLAINLSVNNSLEWGTPVLHLRAPDGALFALEGKAVPHAQPAPPPVVIHSNGGTVVVGDVHTAGGDFVGRDEITQHPDPAPVEPKRQTPPTGQHPPDEPKKKSPPVQSALPKRLFPGVIRHWKTLAIGFGMMTLLGVFVMLGKQLWNSAAQNTIGSMTPSPSARPLTPATITLAPLPPTPSPTKMPSPTETLVPGITDTPLPATAAPTGPITYPTQVSEKDGMRMVYVPAGEFSMGSKNGSGEEDETPAHIVSLDAFWVDQTEVTNAMYRLCVAAQVCQLPGGVTFYNDPQYAQHPVVYVSWKQADSYCRWAGRRLPTEAEWEKAARGTDRRIYPWGNQTPNGRLANFGQNEKGTTPVGHYSPQGDSAYGCADMAGNVWEWVQDWYAPDYYKTSPQQNPTGPKGTYKVVRGGGWYNDSSYLHSASRYSHEPGFYDINFGFRCVASAEK